VSQYGSRAGGGIGRTPYLATNAPRVRTRHAGRGQATAAVSGIPGATLCRPHSGERSPSLLLCRRNLKRFWAVIRAHIRTMARGTLCAVIKPVITRMPGASRRAACRRCLTESLDTTVYDVYPSGHGEVVSPRRVLAHPSYRARGSPMPGITYPAC